MSNVIDLEAVRADRAPIRATDNAVILSTGQLTPEERALFDEIERIICRARETQMKLFSTQKGRPIL